MCIAVGVTFMSISISNIFTYDAFYGNFKITLGLSGMSRRSVSVVAWERLRGAKVPVSSSLRQTDHREDLHRISEKK